MRLAAHLARGCVTVLDPGAGALAFVVLSHMGTAHEHVAANPRWLVRLFGRILVRKRASEVSIMLQPADAIPRESQARRRPVPARYVHHG